MFSILFSLDSASRAPAARRYAPPSGVVRRSADASADNSNGADAPMDFQLTHGAAQMKEVRTFRCWAGFLEMSALWRYERR
jgi:hypothetical protein